MKELFTLSFFLLFMTSIQAQAVDFQRVSELMPENYAVTGQAFLEQLTNGDLQMRLSPDFSTPSGPDVRILLNNQKSLSGAVELINLTNVNHFNGALTVDVAPSIDINEYDFVLFYCVQFGLFWASGEFDSALSLNVELSSFTANADKNNITLDWTTLSEENNAGFEIERSVDGREYTQISFSAADEPTSNRRKDYSYTDTNLQPNLIYYYRLKQVDRDGKFEYSDIATATIKGNSSTTISEVYPNPVREDGVAQFGVTVENNTNNAAYSLYNQNGSEVRTAKFQLNTGFNNVNINSEDLPSGLYFMKIEVDNEVFFKKLVR